MEGIPDLDCSNPLLIMLSPEQMSTRCGDEIRRELFAEPELSKRSTSELAADYRFNRRDFHASFSFKDGLGRNLKIRSSARQRANPTHSRP